MIKFLEKGDYYLSLLTVAQQLILTMFNRPGNLKGVAGF